MSVVIGMLGVMHAHAGGRMARLKEAPEVRVAGAADPNPEIVSQAKNSPQFAGIHWYASPEALLEDPEVQGVWVEGRPLENLNLARMALTHDKHVLVDKPAGLSLTELREVLNLAKERNKHFQMGYNFRYHTGFEFIIKVVEEGLLGDIFFVRGRIATNKSGHESRLPVLIQYPGGTFYELCCHYLDIYTRLLGRPKGVTGFMRNHYAKDPRFMDNTLTVFEYDRALAVLESSDMEVSAFDVRRVEVYGTRGSVVMEPVEPPVVRLCLEEAQGGYKAGWQNVDVGDRPRYIGDIEEFVACVEGRKSPDYGPDHDLLVQEVLLRACGADSRTL